MIKLNMNENPYLPPENVINAAVRNLKNINRYSELEDINKLKSLISNYCHISQNRVILAPGSDFLLREIIHVFSKDRKIIMVNPSFFPALNAAKKNSKKMIKYQLVPPEFRLNPEIILDELYEPTLIIIDNPNNPLGKILLDKNLVEKILQNESVLLVVDEAYYEFSEYTFANLIENYPNLAITRTMDKAFSLAGLRLGYLLAGDYFRNKFSDFPIFLPVPTLYAAMEALKDIEYVTQNVKKIVDERKRLEENLRKLGIEVFSTNTNFVLIKNRIPDFGKKLLDAGIMIKDLSQEWLDDFYRISVGLPEENDILLSSIENIMTNRSQ